MSSIEKVIHRLLISLAFTALNWIVVDGLIVEISFWRYLFIELILVISMKFSTFTIRKMKL